MGAIEDIQYVRLLIDDRDPSNEFLTDGQILALIRKTTTFNGAAAIAWGAKAGSYAKLIDMSESGVDRKLSQMYRQADNEAKRYLGQVQAELTQIAKALRVGPKAGLPYGRKVAVYATQQDFLSYIIGDYSRGPSGIITFVDIITPASAPVTDADTLVVDDEWDINIIRGVTWDMSSTYRQPGGAVVDLTGYQARMVIQPGNPLLTLTDTAGITLGGVAGTVDTVITDVQATTLPVGLYEYKMTLIAPDGSVLPYLSGIAEVSDA